MSNTHQTQIPVNNSNIRKALLSSWRLPHTAASPSAECQPVMTDTFHTSPLNFAHARASYFSINWDLCWLPGNKWSCLGLLIYHHTVLPVLFSCAPPKPPFYLSLFSSLTYFYTFGCVQVIYVAPMKALAAEMTKYFSKRLEPLGIAVKELTGDMQLSKGEILRTQVHTPLTPKVFKQSTKTQVYYKSNYKSSSTYSTCSLAPPSGIICDSLFINHLSLI